MSKSPKTHNVTITLDDDQIKCAPRRLFVDPNDSIVFKCADKSPFAIHFHPLSPAEKIRYRSGSENQLTAKILENAAPGRYEFFIALCDKKNDIWTDDPDIIIPPTR
jgi:hypothetical protein